MFMQEALPFIEGFVSSLEKALKEIDSDASLSKAQKLWLSFCITAILITNSINWSKFEKISLRKCGLAALSWLFRNSKIPWNLLLRASVRVIIHKYGITKGILVADDSEKKRSKVTKRIFQVHKVKDKSTGGYFMGQSVVFLLLVTDKITIPIGFEFYMPDPALSQWYQLDKKLKAQGVPKSQRPNRPKKNPLYPTKQELVLRLIEEFKHHHPEVKVKLILVDGLYANNEFIDKASAIYDQVQVISQLRSNQKIRFRDKEVSIAQYFRRSGVPYKIRIRGAEEKITVIIDSARLFVCSHGIKRFIVALKYPGEDEYRYLVACDLSWRTLDIVQGYTFRWLAEVFIEDLKSYEAWRQSAKQTDEEGSRRSLILSLLLDHCLFFHPDQQARLENKLPAYTVGSLIEKAKVQCFLQFLHSLISGDNLQQKIDLLIASIDSIFKLSLSKKHMSGRDLGRFEPTLSLRYRANFHLT
jgi:hypothetical protein